ncbi:MAG: class I SAM-dependent methyltransferase [Thalassobaculaceae bacterium]|nr:class I SAM-dependent methyltransferase [Thalassobaculaceae bacterium]
MSDGWTESADAWIAEQGQTGDRSRQFILDARMVACARVLAPGHALDIGCGEGRFCRVMRDLGLTTIGIDPTEPLLDRARALDPDGDYRAAVAEDLPFADASFDLVVSYLTLIDIPDIDRAIAEMTRVLKPGGRLLLANLNGFASALVGGSWQADGHGNSRFLIDNYLEERVAWAEWKGIRIRNWHRPLSRYMSALLANRLILRHFDEPAPTGGDAAWADRNRRVPFFHVMEWQKPG